MMGVAGYLNRLGSVHSMSKGSRNIFCDKFMVLSESHPAGNLLACILGCFRFR